MPYNLKNKKILITGASGGIGRALCKRFLENECILICTTSNSDKIDKLKNEFGSENFYYKLDLSDGSKIKSNINLITEKHNDISVFISNAGLTKDSLVLRMNQNQWNDVININLNSNYYIIKEILPSMIKNKTGCIIGISSLVALTGNPGQANYTASKSGMISMFKSIALEVASRNINVNVVSPGFIVSPMTDKLNENQKKNILEKIPLRRFGHPNDIAELVYFLSNDESNYITGQNIHVNGGMLMV